MQEGENPELIRRYLLRDLNEPQQEQIEERLLSDEELQSRLSEAEDDLIDDYVLRSLPERDDRLFKQNFLSNPERLHKLHLSQGLLKYTETEAINHPRLFRTTAPITPPRRLPHFLQAKRLAVAASAAVILLLVGYGGWRVYQHRLLENRLSERLRVEQELARLNSGQINEPQAAIATVTLGPLLRDVGEIRRGVITEGTDILQLKLKLDEDKFSSYQAVIETDEGIEMYTIDQLKAKVDHGNPALTLNLPSRLLPTGSYQVHLRGIAEEQTVDLGIYPVQVVLK